MDEGPPQAVRIPKRAKPWSRKHIGVKTGVRTGELACVLTSADVACWSEPKLDGGLDPLITLQDECETDRFGRETRTPAMQAGLVSQRLALRDIFTAGGLTRRIFVAVVHVSVTVQPTESDEAELSTRCSPSARRQAA